MNPSDDWFRRNVRSRPTERRITRQAAVRAGLIYAAAIAVAGFLYAMNVLGRSL